MYQSTYSKGRRRFVDNNILRDYYKSYCTKRVLLAIPTKHRRLAVELNNGGTTTEAASEETNYFTRVIAVLENREK